MLRHSTKGLLLGLALLLSQWMLLAHNYSHPAAVSATHVCDFCVSGQGLSAGVATATAECISPDLRHQAPRTALPAPPSLRSTRHTAICGPPSFLA